MWKSRVLLFSAFVLSMLLMAGQTMGQAADEAEAAGGDGAGPFAVFGLVSFSDPTTIVIILCSILAVTLIVQAFLRVRKTVLLPDESAGQIAEMIENRKLNDLLAYTEQDPSFLSRCLNPALKRAPSFTSMREALENAVAENTAEEFRKIEYINILANVGPLLGLLGTVIGIMQAFVGLQQAGDEGANPAELATGISVALTTTMLGLLLAIPCLAAYGILRNKVDRITADGALQAEDMLLELKPDAGGKSSSRSSSSTGTPPAAKSSTRAATPA
ncbi:MAG: MotA/TolQ/ExbB proton channel family protein [Phycisphaerae bacterium]